MTHIVQFSSVTNITDKNKIHYRLTSTLLFVNMKATILGNLTCNIFIELANTMKLYNFIFTELPFKMVSGDVTALHRFMENVYFKFKYYLSEICIYTATIALN